MDKVCREFEVDFEYFIDDRQVNNVKKNQGTIAYSVGTINHLPEGILENIIKRLEVIEQKIKD